MKGSPAVFLDKDGTLIEDVPYNVDPALIRLGPGAADGLRLLHAAGYPLIVISNQSGVARGYFEEAALGAVEARLRELLGDGVASLRVVRRYHTFRYPSPEHWLVTVRSLYGPMLKAFDALDEPGQERLAGDLLRLAHRFNRSGDATLAAPAEYLDVVAVKAGAGASGTVQPPDRR